MNEKDKVTIGICSPGVVSTNFMTSILDIARSQKQLGQFISLQGSGVISRLRNQVAATFLDATKDDWLLMIDTDEMLSKDNFAKLLQSADAKFRPIVSGVVFGAWETGEIYPEPVPCIFKTNSTGGLFPVHEYEKDQLIEIDAAGTGCLLVHRKVLERFRQDANEHQGKMWGFFQDMPLNGEWIGEDILFSLRAKSFGYRLFAHTGVLLPHERKYWLKDVHHEDFKRFAKVPHMSQIPDREDNNGNK